MITDGITIADLSQLLGVTPDDAERGLLGLKPIRGVQQRARVYPLWEAMQAMTNSGGGIDDQQLEEAIKSMKPAQLPVALQSEFWKAQRSRNEYLTENQDLWRTGKVQTAVATIFKVVRQSMTLLEDNVDQQTALTPRQRDIVRGIADSVLGELRDAIVDNFSDWDGSDDREDDNPAKGVKDGVST